MVPFTLTQKMADEEAPSSIASSRGDENLPKDDDTWLASKKSADNTSADSYTKLSKRFYFVSAIGVGLMLTSLGAIAGLHFQSKQQGIAMIRAVQEHGFTSAEDELGVSHLIDNSGRDLSVQSSSIVVPTIQRFDTTDNNRALYCVSARVAATMVHGEMSGTAVSLAFFDKNGLEKQVMPLSGGFTDNGSMLQFGSPSTRVVGIILDSDACNNAANKPLDIEAAAPEDESMSTSILDADGGRKRHLVGDHTLKSSAKTVQESQSDILRRNRAIYMAHRRALQVRPVVKPGFDSGTDSRHLQWTFGPEQSQQDFDSFTVGGDTVIPEDALYEVSGQDFDFGAYIDVSAVRVTSLVGDTYVGNPSRFVKDDPI